MIVKIAIGLPLKEFVQQLPTGTKVIVRHKQKCYPCGFHYLHDQFIAGDKIERYSNNIRLFERNKNSQIEYCTKRRGKFYIELYHLS